VIALSGRNLTQAGHVTTVACIAYNPVFKDRAEELSNEFPRTLFVVNRSLCPDSVSLARRFRFSEAAF